MTGTAAAPDRSGEGRRPGWLTRIFRWSRSIVVALAAEWRQDRIPGLAAEIAFFGLLSFFPGLLATAAALGSLRAVVGGEAADAARETVLDFFSNVLSDQADTTLAAVRELFTEASPGLLTLGLVVALWAASRAFVAVIWALDIAYDLEERRGYLQTRLTALVLGLGTVVVAALLVVAVAVGPLLGGGRQVADAVGLGGGFAVLWDWLRWPFAVGALLSWTAVVFRYAPFHRVAWRWTVPGAVLTSAAWLIFTVGLHLYLAYARNTNPVFGTLGGALILVVWLYLLAVGFLLGGELNALVIVRRGAVSAPGRHWSVPAPLRQLIHSSLAALRRSASRLTTRRDGRRKKAGSPSG